MSNQTPQQPHENPKRAQILQTAESLITGQRQEDYGTPEENFARIAGFWNIHLKSILKEELTARQVAELMVLLKMARLANSPTEDSYVDIAGYAAIAAEIADSTLFEETSIPKENKASQPQESIFNFDFSNLNADTEQFSKLVQEKINAFNKTFGKFDFLK